VINAIRVEGKDQRLLRELVADPIVLDPLFQLAEIDETYVCLRFVDPYGDTVFNADQAEQVIVELEMLSQRTSTPAQRAVLAEIAALAAFAREEPHRYLRFVGD
jgi:hypothetical protein